MFILDTNIISELIKKEPNNNVLTWLSHQLEDNLYLSVVSLIELKKGVFLMEESHKRQHIINWLDNSLLNRFEERLGITLHLMDALIAATALVTGYQIVTRNIKDFKHTNTKIINPWDY